MVPVFMPPQVTYINPFYVSVLFVIAGKCMGKDKSSPLSSSFCGLSSYVIKRSTFLSHSTAVNFAC